MTLSPGRARRAPRGRDTGLETDPAGEPACCYDGAHHKTITPSYRCGHPRVIWSQGLLYHPIKNHHQHQLAISGITCSRGSGLIEISPVKGRSCASISNIDAATPVAKSPIAMIEESRLSLWTIAVATRAQIACKNRADHLTKLTCDWLTRMRCRRASSAVSSPATISRCAVF
jgi:hypothetical protein